MNYKKLYSKLISKAKKANRSRGAGAYYEEHHILPRSLFSALEDHKGNLVLLTPREHYVAHWLLTKICPSKSMTFAFMAMANKASKEGSRQGYNVNSRTFQKLKKEFSVNNPAKSATARKKISESKRGENHHFYKAAPETTPAYKPEEYTFVRDDGSKIKGTRTYIFEHTDLSRANISNLITGYRYTAKGWYMEGVEKPEARKTKYANGADTTLYCWYNTNTGMGYVCDRYDFERLSGLKKKSIRTLIYNERNSVFGWVLQ